MDAVPRVLKTSNLGDTEALLLKTTLPEIEALPVSSNGEEIDTPPEKTLRAVQVLDADLEATPLTPQLRWMKDSEAVGAVMTKELLSKEIEP